MRRVSRFFKNEIDLNPNGYQRRIDNDLVCSNLLIDMPFENDFIEFCMSQPTLKYKFPLFKRIIGPQEGYILFAGFFIKYEMILSFYDVKILYNFFQNLRDMSNGQAELYFETLDEPYIQLNYPREIISEELY